MPWWLGGFKGTLLRALANVSVTVNNVVVKYLAPRSVATLTCTRLATFTADLGDSAISEARLMTHLACTCRLSASGPEHRTRRSVLVKQLVRRHG